MQAGDNNCELNLGPQEINSCSKFPCRACNDHCSWDQKAIQCDECNEWYYTQCMGLNTINYEILGNSNISWTCCNSGIPNYSTSLFAQFSLETSNSFASLSNTSVGLDDIPFSPPAAASSPKDTAPKSFKPPKPKPKRQIKIMVVNFQSVKNKVAELAASLDYHDPDIVLGSETWLNSTVDSN